MNRKPITRILSLASLILFFLSLTQNCICISADCGRYPGWSLLLLGWLEILGIGDVGPFVILSWYANPVLLLTWIFLRTRKRRTALVLACLALALALSFLLSKQILASESGIAEPITGYGIGYWLWLGSTLSALLAAASKLATTADSEPSKP